MLSSVSPCFYIVSSLPWFLSSSRKKLRNTFSQATMISISGNENIDNMIMDKIQTKKAEAAGKKQQKVSLLKLFAFADLYDYVLMGLGSVGACIHGASVPVFFIYFGKMINIIGLAYLFPRQTSHRVAKVYSNYKFMQLRMPTYGSLFRLCFFLLLF